MGLHNQTKATTKNIEDKVQETVVDLTDDSEHLALPLNSTT